MKKSKKQKGGKNILVEAVMAKGFTARKSAEAVNALLERMRFGLWCGDEVPIPGGTIQTQIRQGKPRLELQPFENVNTGKHMSKFIRYPGRHRVIKFRPDESLDLTPPPPPEPPEVTEARQLATEILNLKKPADNALLSALQDAVDLRPNKPGALLRRLRAVKVRYGHLANVRSLAEQLYAH